MPHQPLSTAARTLQTDEKTLLDFAQKSWIQPIEKHGMIFLDGQQRYKARYILHLRIRRKLSDEQITLVLSVQGPPYSLDEVDEILAAAAKPI